MYRIKHVSRLTGLSTETIRYYERIGVLKEPSRSDNGYRAYSDNDVDRLRFIRRARQLHFPLDTITEILALRDQGTQPCEYVQNLIRGKISEIQTRIQELKQLRDELIALSEIGAINAPPAKSCSVCQILETDLVKKAGKPT